MDNNIMSREDFIDGHYNSYGSDNHPDKKKDYRRTIISYWTSSRTQEIPHPNPLQAMEELYNEFQEDSMIIINFTNRNRKDILKDIRADFSYGEPAFEIRGLNAVLEEWERQVKKPKEKDSLELLIQSKPELYSKSAYMITAMIHRVRRLRAGSKKNPGNLVLADGILSEARRLSDEPGENIGINLATLPNEHLGLMLEMQIHLQDIRRQDPLQNNSDLEDYTSRLKELHSTPATCPSPGIAVYYWWALRISHMRARANLEFREAEVFIERMNSVRSGMNDRVGSYIDCIEEGEEKNKPRDPENVSYHNALAEFMYYSDKSVCGKDSPLRDKEGLLYKAALDNDSAATFTRLFAWCTTTNSEALIKRCRKSIIDAKTCISSISYRGSSSARAMLMLVSVELLMKIRWYLSVSHIFRYRSERTLNIDGMSELEIAQEFRDEIAHALSRVQKQTFRSSDGAEQMHDLVGNWVEAFSCLEYENTQSYTIPGCESTISSRYDPEDDGSGDSIYQIGPLGQLCNFCGSMLGWRWTPLRDESGNDTWDEDDTIHLYGFRLSGGKPIIDSEPWLEVSTKRDTNNPYLRRVGESSSDR